MSTSAKITAILVTAALMLSAVASLSGCLGGKNDKARERVREAMAIIEGSRQLLEDLVNLDNRFNTLGTRFSAVEDTITEGKSLAEMALIDVDELESRYTEARDLLLEVSGMENAGEYAQYARLALQAVEKELEAMAANRELLKAVSDMLDVLPMAQSQDQLSYYVEEIDRLTSKVSALMEEGAAAAAESDRYYREHDL